MKSWKDSLFWLILVRKVLLKPYFGGNLGLKLEIIGSSLETWKFQLKEVDIPLPKAGYITTIVLKSCSETSYRKERRQSTIDLERCTETSY